MRAPYSLSCLFLLSLGACIPPGERWEPGRPGEGTLPGPRWQPAAEDPCAGWRAGAKRRRSEELDALLGIARELRGSTGQRPGRRGGSEVLPAAGEKRSGTLGNLGNLAEELNGYNRKKGGFTFRFGR
ncbi:OX26 protein, partial [Mionectes macconnelli]|nr:OX26 protein [Mionectes macconnelli]NWT07518.1 OX26 protein [Mionectes macconnelli]